MKVALTSGTKSHIVYTMTGTIEGEFLSKINLNKIDFSVQEKLRIEKDYQDGTYLTCSEQVLEDTLKFSSNGKEIQREKLESLTNENLFSIIEEAIEEE